MHPDNSHEESGLTDGTASSDGPAQSGGPFLSDHAPSLSHEPPDTVRVPFLASRGTRVVLTSALAGGLALGGFGIASAASATGSGASPAATPKAPLPPGMGGRHGRGRFGGVGSGTVTAINGSAVTVSTPAGMQRTVTTTSSTIYREGGKTVSASALAVGEHVMVRPVKPITGSSASSGSTFVTAAAIDIVRPQVRGTVVGVSGTTVTVADSQGFWRTVDVSSGTTVTRGGQSSTTSAIATGEHVVATGTIEANHTSLAASMVGIQLPRVGGMVTAVSGSTITVTRRNGSALQIDTSSTTVFSTAPGRSASSTGSLSDVKTGSMIAAEGTKNTDGSFSATRIVILPAPRSGGPLGGSAPVPPSTGSSATSGSGTSA